MIQLTFFEQELRKIVDRQYPGATYVGRACYIPLGETNRAKIEFVTCGTMDYYEALRISILNRHDGQVDTLLLRFSDVWGKGQVDNFYIKQKGPYIWTYDGKTEWYAYHPNIVAYRQLTEAVGNYLDVFQDQVQTAGQQWQQTM